MIRRMFQRLLVEKDVPIQVRDGGTVLANVFRPADDGQYPVILTLGPYPKDIHFSQWNPAAWERMTVQNEHMHWETVDPEWWVPQGYAVVRCDTRGTGKSPGRARMLSRAEAEDFHDCVEWAGTQSFSNGKVAVMGVSYFAMNAWRVAALRPPHLAAIVPWEGAVDLYRDANRHGGIFSSGFMRAWGGHTRQVSDRRRRVEPGAAAARDADRARSRAAIRTSPTSRCRCSRRGTGPGQGSTCAATSRASSARAPSTSTCRCTWATTSARSTRSRAGSTQLRFLEQFCRGVDTGITREPPIRLAIRRDADTYRWRYENEWPIARTQWTEQHLDASAPRALDRAADARRARPATAPSPARRGRALRFATRAARARNRGHRADRAQALGLDDGRRRGPLRDRAQPATRRDGGPLPGSAAVGRKQGRGRVRLAARLTPKARPRALDSVPAVPHARRDPEGPARRARGGRDRDPADQRRVRARTPPGDRDRRAGRSAHPVPARRAARPDPDAARCTIHTGGRFDSHLLLPIVPER